MESSQEFLKVYYANPADIHTCLVTGDETWLHYLKKWERTGSSHLRHIEPNHQPEREWPRFLGDSKKECSIPTGTLITGEYYANVIKQLMVAII